MSVVYVVDTCVWVNFSTEHLLSDILAQLAPHAIGGHIKAHAKVLDELKRRWPSVYKEVAKLPVRAKSTIDAAPAVVVLAGQILHAHPYLAKALLPENRADPWIIASAEVHGWTVVTDDGSGRRPSRSITGVCKKRGIAVLDRVAFAKALGIKF